MRKSTRLLAICLIVPCLGTAGITIQSPASERTDVPSPMIVTAPIETSIPQLGYPYAKTLFETEELAYTVCDAVMLKTVKASVIFDKKRSKGEIILFVTTYTEPPQDKKAFITARIQNDEESLIFAAAGYPGQNQIVMKINAEEKSTRSKSKRAKFKPDQLERILAGDNPRIQLTLEVIEN